MLWGKAPYLHKIVQLRKITLLALKCDYTLTSPSADPVAKNSSFGSNAMHFTATEDSCAVNLWRNVLCLKSHRQTIPFRPAEIKSWCWEAYSKLVPPFSWQTNAKSQDRNAIMRETIINVVIKFLALLYLQCMTALRCGISVSHRTTLRDSELWPVVAKTLEDPRKTKSDVPLLWHWCVWNADRDKQIRYFSLDNNKIQLFLTKKGRWGVEPPPRRSVHKATWPSPSATPNLFPWLLKRRRFTFA